MRARVPENEPGRLAALHGYAVLDSPPEEGYDEIVRLAARVCDTPIALITFVDAERQWFKARVGLPECETHRDMAFCAHALLEPHELLIVRDARADPRFADNPLVTGQPHVRFYAGAPLVTPEGLALGTLCVLDRQPRVLAPEQIDTLKALRRFVMTHLELRRASNLLHERSARLERANAELDAFAATVAHDLRAPLRAVEGFAAALREDHAAALDEAGRGYLGRIRHAVGRMELLIGDLLDYSRMARGRIALEPVALDALVSDALGQLGGELKRRQAQVHVEPPLPLVRGDRAVLSQVLINLLDNACKFVEEGVPPRVRLHVEPRGPGLVRVWVEDNGIGISHEHHQRIFNVFERLHGVEAYPGTGVGLAFVRTAVERMGGSVGVESSPREGSRFWIELPTPAGAERARRAEVTAPNPSGDAGA